MKRFFFILFLIVPQLLLAVEKSSTDSLVQQLDKASSSREKIIIYNKIAKAYWYNSPAKTIEYGEKALALSIEIENDSLIILFLGLIHRGSASGSFISSINQKTEKGISSYRNKKGYIIPTG